MLIIPHDSYKLTKGARNVCEALAMQYVDARAGEERCKQQHSESQHNHKSGVTVQEVLVPVVGSDLHSSGSKQPPRREYLCSGSHPALINRAISIQVRAPQPHPCS